MQVHLRSRQSVSMLKTVYFEHLFICATDEKSFSYVCWEVQRVPAFINYHYLQQALDQLLADLVAVCMQISSGVTM